MNWDEMVGQDLRWTQTHRLQQIFRLSSGEVEYLAELSVESRTRAVGIASENQWTFQRHGIFSHRIDIQEAGSNSEALSFHSRSPGWGSIDFPSGVHYELKHEGFLQRTWTFEDSEGISVLSCEGSSGFWHRLGGVRISRAGINPKELSVLLLLACFAIILHSQDQAEADSALAVI